MTPEQKFLTSIGTLQEIADAMNRRKLPRKVTCEAVRHWVKRGAPHWARPYLMAIGHANGIVAPANFLTPGVNDD